MRPSRRAFVIMLVNRTEWTVVDGDETGYVAVFGFHYQLACRETWAHLSKLVLHGNSELKAEPAGCRPGVGVQDAVYHCLGFVIGQGDGGCSCLSWALELLVARVPRAKQGDRQDQCAKRWQGVFAACPSGAGLNEGGAGWLVCPRHPENLFGCSGKAFLF